MEAFENPAVAAVAGGIAGALVTVFVSWLVASRSKNKDHLRERVKNIESEIRELETVAIRYWVTELNDEAASGAERQIKRIKTAVGKELTRLRKNKFSCSKDCDVRLYEINRAATSAPFEGRPHLPNPLLVPQIQDAVDAFVDELRSCLSVI